MAKQPKSSPHDEVLRVSDKSGLRESVALSQLHSIVAHLYLAVFYSSDY